MPQDLPLEPDLIKVLASDTRRDILRHLRERDMTVTELARELDLGKATVHEHLNKLTTAGLAERREDDRLWVYYRLTGEGKRMLNPQRTRFYLIVAVSALAGIAAILAIALFLSLGGGPGLPGDGTANQAAEDGAFSVAVTERQAYAGGPLAFDAIIQGAEAGTLTAYLVSPQDALALAQGDTSVLGHPMTIRMASQAAAEDSQMASSEPSADGEEDRLLAQPVVLEGSSQLPAGTYLLYVRGQEVDNRETMPTVRVHSTEMSLSTTTWYQGASQPLVMEISREGEPVLGTVRLVAERSTTGGQLSAELTGATAHLDADLLDALPPGTYTAEVLPQGGDHWLPLQPKLRIVQAQLTATPLHLGPEGGRVHVDLAPSGTPNLEAGQVDVNTTQPFTLEPAGHGLTLQLTGESPASASVQAFRLDPIEIQLHRTPRLSLEIQDGPVWELHAETPAGHPSTDLQVRLDGEIIGTTDARGNLTIDPLPDPGEHVLAFSGPNGTDHQLGLEVDGWAPRALHPELAVRPLDVETHAAGAALTLRVTNGGPATTPATLHVRDAGGLLATQAVTVPGNASQTVVLNVPLTDPGDHSLQVTHSPLAASSLLVTNATTPEDTQAPTDGDDGSGGGGGTGGGDAGGTDGADGAPPTDGGDDADTAAMQESTLAGDGTTINVVVEDGSTASDALMAEDGRQLLEPVGPDPSSAMDEGGAAETPAISGLTIALLAALVALVARARTRG